MKYQVTIELKETNALGYWTNCRKIFNARSFSDATEKAEKDLLKHGLHRLGDYNILDIRRA